MDLLGGNVRAKNIYHTYGKYKMFGINVPHEIIVLQFFSYLIMNNQQLEDDFYLFCIKYYYKTEFVSKFFEIVNFRDFLHQQCNQAEMYLRFNYIDKVSVKPSHINYAMLLGDIILDFLIRCYGYTLLGCSKQKVLITSSKNPDKEFEEFLTEGYYIEKRGKVEYLGNGKFKELRALPTKDVDYVDDEIIEMPDGSYQRLLRPYNALKK
ncbi:MAG: hypothetical protein IJO33_04215 [Bacilli bacterium]|nr:hypothetical protein [Bacilli bacterium]